MLKQQTKKDRVYESIVQTHQNTLKQYLELAPRIDPKHEKSKEAHNLMDSPLKRSLIP